MVEHEEIKDITPQKISINLPDGTSWSPDEGADFSELLDKLLDFVKSPEFVSNILPVMAEQFERKHIETLERMAIEKQKLMLKGKFEIQFLVARLVIGAGLISTVTWLTLTGNLATETTIVTLMATLGFIMWGKGNS